MGLARAAEFGMDREFCLGQAELDTFESCRAVLEQGLRIGKP